ncbi:hypothetical protein [Chamaesiphon minutus]|uniref:hypothetical protein n=1 Tax=Chamaesiphon minutus TaxID=1173032 RepID=UPI0005A20DC5|nr:hypothetical protein [Chamaesiphon minutus]
MAQVSENGNFIVKAFTLDRTSPEKNAKMSALSTELLIEVFCSILADRTQLNSKSRAALRYIEQSHNLQKNIEILEKVYDSF